MKYLKPFLAACFLLATLCIISSFTSDNSIKDQLHGTWKWVHVVNSETQDIMGIDMLTMGLAKDVKTEFGPDSLYKEHKNKLEGEGYSTTTGKWGFDAEKNMLMMRPKEKWNAAKLISLTKDTLVIEIRKPMHLVMVREK